MSHQAPKITIPQPSSLGEVVVLLPRIDDLAKFQGSGPANVESTSRSIDYDMTTLAGAQFSDSNAYPDNEYNRETKTLSALSELAEAGQTFVSILYPYRSTARALQPPQKIPGEDDEDYRSKMVLYHQQAFTILYPEIDKIKKVMFYCFKCITNVQQAFEHIVSQEQQKNVQSHPYLDLFILIINNLVLLNSLKNGKASLTNDFSAYKRSFGSIRASLPEEQANGIGEDIHALQLFLGNPHHPRDLILFILRNAIQSTPNYDLGIIALFDHVRDCIETSRWMHPEKEMVYYRLIPFLYYLLDTDVKFSEKQAKMAHDPGDKTPRFGVPKKDIIAFKVKNIDHAYWKKIVRNHPVLPLYGDMHITMILLLRNCAHWDEDAMLEDWCATSPKEIKKIGDSYLLVQHHESIRLEYNKFMSDFAALLSETRALREGKKPITPIILHRVLEQVLFGLRMVSRWSGLVLNQCAWKYAHPVNEEEYKRLKEKAGASADQQQGNPSEYEKAVRFNYTQRELHVLIDVLGMIKGVGSCMLENELTITPLLNRSVHDNCQIFLQTEVARPLRKAYKNDRKDVLDLLLQIREIGGDWFDFAKQKDDYLKPKKELLQVNRDFPRRPTAPSATQLALIRRMIHMVWSPKAAGMKGGIFSKKNLKDEWLATWQEFYHKSYYYQYLLDYGNTIKQVTDLSFLWFHEFYLEVTQCIQFPISMSIPWVMTDYLIQNRNMKDNMFFLFDIYNDAASKSLRVLKQQFLYEEIEAELNLAFEQLLYILSTDVFTYYKSVAGSMLIDKQYKGKYEQVKQSDCLTVRLVRYKSIVSQTRVSLLGRCLDVSLLVAEHCNRLLKENIQNAIKRFESQDFTAIVELSRLFKHIKLTHKLLSRLLILDPLHQLFRECDESVGLCQFRSRIMTHAFTELVADIFPRYIFNQTTQRFVRSPEYLKDEANPEVVRELPPRFESYMWFGKGFKDAYDRENQLFRGFVGIEHCTALLEVMASGQEYMLAREITEDVLTKFMTETIDYIEIIQSAMNPSRPPTLQMNVIAAYTGFEAKLKQLSHWAPLRSGCFSRIRELGNAIAFLMLFEDSMHIKSHFTFQTETFFNGIRPIPPRDPSMPPLAEAYQELFIRDYHEPEKLPYVHHITQSMTSLWNMAVQNDFSKMTYFNEDNPSTRPVTRIETKDWFSPPFQHNEVHQDTGVVIGNVIDNAHASGYNLLLRATHNPPSITSAAIARMIQACQDCDLTTKLSSHGQIQTFMREQTTLENHAQPRVIDLEFGQDISRIISSLFFIFNQPHQAGESRKWGWETKATSSMLGDTAIFGHGLILGFATILHVFGERYRFELVDYCNSVLRIDLVSPLPRGPVDPKSKDASLNSQLLPEAQKFLQNAYVSKEIIINYLNILESFCPAPTPDIQPLNPLDCIPQQSTQIQSELRVSSLTPIKREETFISHGTSTLDSRNSFTSQSQSFNTPSLSQPNVPPQAPQAPMAPPTPTSRTSLSQNQSFTAPAAPQAPQAPMAPPTPTSRNSMSQNQSFTAPQAPQAPMAPPSAPQAPQAPPSAPQAPVPGWNPNVSIEQNYDYDDSGLDFASTPKHRDTAVSFGGFNEDIIDTAEPHFSTHVGTIAEDDSNQQQQYYDNNQYQDNYNNNYEQQQYYDQQQNDYSHVQPPPPQDDYSHIQPPPPQNDYAHIPPPSAPRPPPGPPPSNWENDDYSHIPPPPR